MLSVWGLGFKSQGFGCEIQGKSLVFGVERLVVRAEG